MVNIYYPRTYNKSMMLSLKLWNNKQYKIYVVDNFDITSYKFYELMPKFFNNFSIVLIPFYGQQNLKKTMVKTIYSHKSKILVIA